MFSDNQVFTAFLISTLLFRVDIAGITKHKVRLKEIFIFTKILFQQYNKKRSFLNIYFFKNRIYKLCIF